MLDIARPGNERKQTYVKAISRVPEILLKRVAEIYEVSVKVLLYTVRKGKKPSPNPTSRLTKHYWL